MPFVDNLAYQLFIVSIAGFLLLYTMSSMYLVYKKKQKNPIDHLKSSSLPLFVIGIYLVASGLYAQLTWPLPGSYNILFYDPFISFGLVLLVLFAAIRYNAKLEYVGLFGLLVGLMAIYYGYLGYSINLTKEPIVLLAMYLCYGLAGIFSYPAALIVDRLPKLEWDIEFSWNFVLILFWIFLLLSSVLSAFVGISAIPQHLISAP